MRATASFRVHGATLHVGRTPAARPRGSPQGLRRPAVACPPPRYAGIPSRKEPAANPTHPLQTAFSRLFTLGTWAAQQAEEFTFADAVAALRAARVRDYDGGASAADRMWSRDKQHLVAAGIELRLDGADRYRRADVPAFRLSSRLSAALVARVRALPLGCDADLESGLRKLAVLGAPILGALMDRAAAGGPAPHRRPTTQVVSVAMLLLAALDAAGEDGLSVTEAVVVSGARHAGELERVARMLLEVSLPFDPPYDAVPLELDGGRVRLYMRTPAVVSPSLTAAELAALHGAGVLGPLVREEAVAA